MTPPSTTERDRGAALPLVLVLIIVAGLIVVPLMTYAATVIKANEVVSNRTKQLEAAKGGVRAALSRPVDIFNECTGTNDLEPEPRINDIKVETTCTFVSDVNSFEAMGSEIPYAAATTQLGAAVPDSFVSGDAGTVDSVSESATETDWWADMSWAGHGVPLPAGDTIWSPYLPRVPGAVRSNVPFDMPGAFGCQVFFPGRYTDPIDLSPSNPDITESDVYFASGIYYFEQPITVSGAIDVVVGYGIEEFGSGCADDIQASANVASPPTTFGIDGGGATWVFGDQGRLVVDDSAGSPSIRFNQRYAGFDDADASEYEGFDRGRRINIMTVNGDATTAGADHDAPDVNHVPRSEVLTSPGDSIAPSPTPPTIDTIDSTGVYQPSAIDYTDAARPPQAMASLAFDAEARKYDDAGGTERGALLVSWDHFTGNAAGGSPITGYDVTVDPADGEGCQPADLVFDADVVSCVITGLDLGTAYDVHLEGENAAGRGPAITDANNVPQSSSPEIFVPDPPEAVVVTASDTEDAARITWDAPADDGGAPITSYTVEAAIVRDPWNQDLPPNAQNASLIVVGGAAPATLQLPATEPNGAPLTLLPIDDSLLPDPSLWTLTPNDLELDVATTAPPGAYTLLYTVTDGTSAQATAEISITVIDVPALNAAPTAHAAQLLLDAGVPTTLLLPATDANGDPLTVTVDTSLLPDPALWTISSNGTALDIETTAPTAEYTLEYTVDDGTNTDTASVAIHVAGTVPVGGCTVETPPLTTSILPATPPDWTVPITIWAPLRTTCDTEALPQLLPDDQGYQFSVFATNAVGDSAAGGSSLITSEFDGSGSPDTWPPPPPPFDPYDPEPVVEILAGGSGTATVSIPGYVAAPMGKISIDNPNGDPISMTGGAFAGTFDVPHTWIVPGFGSGAPDEAPIGFWDSVVLQRTVRIVSRAGNATSIAIVQVNEDGDTYAINDWSVQ